MRGSSSERFNLIPVASPFVGMLSVVVGTVLAVVLVPEDHKPAGALMGAAICMSAGLLFAPGLAVLNHPIAAFRVEHLIMVGLVYWLMLDHLQGAYEMADVGRHAVVLSFVAMGLFACAVWVAAWQRPWQLPRVLKRSAAVELNPRILFAAIVTCAAVTMFRFAWPSDFDVFLMIRSLAGNRWSAPWGRGALGNWESFIDHLQYFGYLLPTLIVVLAYRLRSWMNGMVILSILMTIPCVIFIAHGGSRRVIGVMFGAAMICSVLLRGQRIGFPTLAGMGIGVVMLLIFLQLMLEFRSRGFGEAFDDSGNQELRYDHLHVDDNLLRLAQIIEIIPAHHDYTYEKIWIWVAIRPIPRAIWTNKPVDPGFDLTEAVGKEGVSLTSSVIGELFVSWGWVTVALGGWIYGRLAGGCMRFLSLAPNPPAILLYSMGAMAIFAGLRSMIDIVLMSYILLAWCGVVWLLGFFGFRFRAQHVGASR